MSDFNILDVIVERPEGSFDGMRDGLLPLFADLDGKGDRRWLISFGHERPASLGLRGAINYTVLTRRRSSFGL